MVYVIKKWPIRRQKSKVKENSLIFKNFYIIEEDLVFSWNFKNLGKSIKTKESWKHVQSRKASLSEQQLLSYIKITWITQILQNNINGIREKNMKNKLLLRLFKNFLTNNDFI